MNDEDEPAMIAFHFKTKFKHHSDGISSVVLTYKRGPNGWQDVESIENTWIDDDGKLENKLLGECDVFTNTMFLPALTINLQTCFPSPTLRS